MPNFRNQVLETTLSHVRQRRARRRQAAVSTLAGMLTTVAGVIVGWSVMERPTTNDSQGHPQAAAEPHSFIQRIPEQENRPFRFITHSTHSPSSIERLPDRDPGVRAFRLQALTDEELLSHLPPSQAVALVAKADGSSRLVLLPPPSL